MAHSWLATNAVHPLTVGSLASYPYAIGDFVEPIIAFFTQWRTQMLTLGPIVAGFGVACWFIMNSLSGIMPEWAQNARGWVQRILVGAIVLGLAPALITAFISMGGGGAAP